MSQHTPTQPLAIRAQLHNPALCLDCGLFFNWMHQTKHDGCPECNSKNWKGSEDIRRAVNSHEALLEAAKLGRIAARELTRNRPDWIGSAEVIEAAIAQAEGKNADQR